MVTSAARGWNSVRENLCVKPTLLYVKTPEVFRVNPQLPGDISLDDGGKAIELEKCAKKHIGDNRKDLAKLTDCLFAKLVFVELDTDGKFESGAMILKGRIVSRTPPPRDLSTISQGTYNALQLPTAFVFRVGATELPVTWDDNIPKAQKYTKVADNRLKLVRTFAVELDQIENGSKIDVVCTVPAKHGEWEVVSSDEAASVSGCPLVWDEKRWKSALATIPTPIATHPSANHLMGQSISTEIVTEAFFDASAMDSRMASASRSEAERTEVERR
ncbi:hypothetical protein HDU93_009371, partial [Gonapodya sp. JEL0774]